MKEMSFQELTRFADFAYKWNNQVQKIVLFKAAN